MIYPFDYDDKSPYQLVREWMISFNREVDKDFNVDDVMLCHTIIEEESEEALYELYVSDLGAVIVDPEKLTKELCDLIWVCYFTAAKFGLPIEKAFERVYQSNMSKLDNEGKPILRGDGKILKGPNYKPVDLGDLFVED